MILPAALALTLAGSASAPEVALLSTEPNGAVTDVIFQRLGDARLSSPVARLEHAPGVIVVDAGHPVGILTRSDVLEFLARRPPL